MLESAQRLGKFASVTKDNDIDGVNDCHNDGSLLG